MNTCLTKDVLSSAIAALTRREPREGQRPAQGLAALPQLGQTGLHGPCPTPDQSSGPHTSEEVRCWAHTQAGLLAAGRGLSLPAAHTHQHWQQGSQGHGGWTFCCKHKAHHHPRPG